MNGYGKLRRITDRDAAIVRIPSVALAECDLPVIAQLTFGDDTDL